jgi:hypothetical protein
MTFEVTPQDTYDHIIGSGAFMYPWYMGLTQTGVNDDGSVTDGWSATVRIEDPGDDGVTAFEVSHSRIIAVMQVLTDPECYVRYVSESVVMECERFLRDPDGADFDAVMADEVLQYIAFNEIVFG